MADTFSLYSQLLLMQDGSHPNTWGQLTNTNLNLIDQAMSQVTSIAVSNTNFPLTNFAAAQSQARSLSFNVTGTLSAPVAIVLPTGYPRLYVFYNQVTNSGIAAGQFLLTVQCGTNSATPNVAALAGPTTNNGFGVANLIYCDGNNVYGAQPPGQFSQLNVYQAFAAGTGWTPTPVSMTGGPSYTGTIDTSKSNEFYVAAPNGATNIAFALTNSAPGGQLAGQTIQVAVTQNGTGNTSISWPTSILWPNGVTPTWSLQPNATDLVTLTYTYVGGLLTWLGSVQSDYGATGSTGATYNVKVTTNTFDETVLGLLGITPVGAITVNITVNPGVVMQALSTGTFGLDCSGLPAGSIVNIFNSGYIVGHGGNGGPSSLNLQGISYGWYQGGSAAPAPYAAGGAGGHAINGVGAGNTCNISNLNGHIWGGGGGGGGGGASSNGGGDMGSVGGAGGGGAGGGLGGTGFSGGSSGTFGNILSVPNGTNGLLATNVSAAGTGSAGAQWGASAQGSAAGNGGNWGVAGANGTAATAHTYTLGYGSGGAAGKAYNRNGGNAANISPAGDVQGAN